MNKYIKIRPTVSLSPKIFTVNTTVFFSLYCLLFYIDMFVEIKALMGLYYRILDQNIKFLCPCLCLCLCMSF